VTGAKQPGLTFDTGALIALDRGDHRFLALLDRAQQQNRTIAVPAGVIAQAWRHGSRQARLARLLADPAVLKPPIDDVIAKAVGELCAATGQHDVVDAHVALQARQHGNHVVTSDPHDLRRIDPSIHLIVV
jgi:predicted nucleic acid-binding protein